MVEPIPYYYNRLRQRYESRYDIRIVNVDIGEVGEMDKPCMSFAELVARYELLRFDVLVTDTEGYDYHILKQIEFSKYQPKIVIFESKHLSDIESEKCHRRGGRVCDGMTCVS